MIFETPSCPLYTNAFLGANIAGANRNIGLAKSYAGFEVE